LVDIKISHKLKFQWSSLAISCNFMHGLTNLMTLQILKLYV